VAYLELGRERLADRPDLAAAAYHWATLLDPNASEGFHGRWAALLLADPRRLVGYLERDRKVLASPEVRGIDSLRLHALGLDPLANTAGLDHHLLGGYLTELVRRERRLRGKLIETDADAAELQFEIAHFLKGQAGPYVRGLVAASERRFPQALDLLAQAMRRAKEQAGFHTDRASIFHRTGQLDSAAAELQAALDELRLRDATELIAVYESKALLELSLGALREQQGDLPGAYRAYERSAAEDLAFHPAHARLATLALQRGDTANAVTEIETAIELRPDDAALRVAGAVLLVRAARAAEAVPHVQQAVESNPHWATPRYILARLYDGAGMGAEALAHYQGFLARAAREDTRSPFARERLAALRPAPPDTSGAAVRP
jgi:tetratricopeptide (TPR) repeat protein